MKTRKQSSSRKSKGLILLIVLGMIAMFSLLAVTYVVSAGASRDASFGALRQARNSRFTLENTAIKVMKSALQGTNDLQSPFYKNDIIGDVYGSNFLQTSFHTFNANSGARLFTSATITEQTFVLPTTTLVKVTLNPNFISSNPLSSLENEYNSRILTVLEGPLAGQSFRILKYTGYIRVDNAGPADPNVDATPWSSPTYVDASASLLNSNFSVLIDLNEVVGTRFQGQFYSNNRLRTVSLALPQWIATQGLGLDSLFYQPRLDATSPWEGFRVLINDAPFNSPGIGVEEVASLPDPNPMNPPVQVPGFGNIDSRRLLAIPSNRPKVSPALLPDYDYLKTPGIMAANPLDGGKIGVDGIGVPRTNTTQFRLSGGSNEGYDVPDYRDAWLGFSSYVDHDRDGTTPAVLQVKPSYHQPAVVQYLANLFGTPSSMSFNDVRELLQLIDMSSSRVMSYLGVNEGFNQNVPGYPRLLTTGASPFTWSTPPTAFQIAQLQDYVRKQILGPWDVDNDGDGEADSVWIDPGLPVVYSPEGRRLKPLAAMMILDLDGRVNINVAGDRLQAFSDSFAFSPAGLPFKQPGRTIPNGFGYGPAEISLASLFAPISGQPTNAGAVNNLLRSQSNFFSFFDDRHGARRSPFANSTPINYGLGWDLNAGLQMNTFAGNDIVSVHGERELNVLHPSRYISGTPSNLAAAPAFFGGGMPMLRRGEGGVAFDTMGNPTIVVNASGEPARDTINDPYESAASTMPNHDDPVSLAELEAVLRQFDQDAKGLPDRLKKYLDRAGFVTNDVVSDHVRRAITTRSGELRYPNLAAVSPVGNGLARTVDHRTPSLSRYIQWLHHQRYRQTNGMPVGDDPDLSNAAITELFPMDFFKGLRMDLNQPFGDGFDNDDDGAVDDPQELSQNYVQVNTNGTGFEQEYHRPYESLTKSADGAYLRTIQWNPPVGSATIRSVTRQRLGARQLLARNLYCLAQLIVPREHNFPGMAAPGLAARDASGNVIAANVWPRAQIRARALAQWAVNVVDFRDTDAAMTRFEYDILPFGIGSDFVVAGIAERPAYWAPDRIVYSVNGISNKTYTGVVWGMEMPEVLLSETLAFHDKRVRNTDMDDGTAMNKATILDDMNSDPHFDQFRFPQASLFIELTCPRTTQSRSNVLLPKVPTGLYTADGSGNVALDLGRLAPNGPSGVQPVWRIAISQDYGLVGIDPADHPNQRMAAALGSGFELISHQQVYGVGSTTAATARNGLPLTTAANVEQYIGNGLVYNIADSTALPPAGLTGFERFIWFTPKNAFGGSTPFPTNIPDLLAGTDAVHSVYNPDATNTLIHGGEFLVIGPRTVTSLGSLTHNSYSTPNPTPYPPILTALAAGGQAWRLTPSFQRIDLSGNNVATYKLDNSIANQQFLTDSKAPRSIVCTTPVPSDSGAPAMQNWNASFGPGIGVNISYPTPVNSFTPTDYWYSNAALTGAPRAKRPVVSLNTTDRVASRADGTPGYGDVLTNLPDSFCDLSTIEPTDTFPDVPFDATNPYLGIPGFPGVTVAGRYASGTYENVRVAYLQRLADPEFAYDPFSNPYITVDWMGIDLTVFNGETATEIGNSASSPYRDPASLDLKLYSRYKNGTLVNGGVAGVSYHSPRVNDFSARSTPPQTANIPDSTRDPVPYKYASYCSRMLGYDASLPTWIANTTAAENNNRQASGTTLGYANVGFNSTVGTLVNDTDNASFDGFGRPVNNIEYAYRGVTSNLQNLVWYNRQFATPYELALVPSSNPGQFGFTYSGLSTDPLTGERHPYQALQASQPLVNFGFIPSFQATNAWSTLNAPATHTRGYWAASNPAVGTSYEADWPLMFELLETQAPYIDANRHLPPDEIMALSLAGSSPAMIASAARFINSYIDTNYYGLSEPPTTRGPSLLAPFNKLPSFVAAGKVNLNTISLDPSLQSKALQALEFAYTRGFNVATAFESARHGYDPATAPSNLFFGAALPHFHPEFPTQFVGAYRPAMSSNFAPPLSNPAAPANEGALRGRWGLESSLMRSASFATATNLSPTASPSALLFNVSPASTTDGSGAQPLEHLRRVMRLPNLVTNQSNNFAVWVTVSLFEYDPVTEFGNEYIGPGGTPIRDREFFIIDRTVPVGYKPGENLNTDRTILHKSKIQ
ncbi:MAG: hypothetical protein NTY42_20160 [Planctomycetota bacterium]|nr:hypothetical protein [Planctomycetota bacterium]